MSLKFERSPDFGARRELVMSDFRGNSKSQMGMVVFSPSKRGMEGLWDDLTAIVTKTVQDTTQQTIDAAKNAALATASTEILSNPDVQRALEEKAKRSLIEQGVDKVYQTVESVQTYVKQNTTQVLLMSALAAAVVGGGVYMLARKKKR